MKILWNKSHLIERYLLDPTAVSKRRNLKHLLQRVPGLWQEVQWQKEVYSLVRIYHRKKIREQLEDVHQQLFSDKNRSVFQNKIYRLFKPNEK